MASVTVSIVGATGYAGAELLRQLIGHPAVTVSQCISTSRAGQRIDAIHPALTGFVDGVFVGPDDLDLDVDVLFLATPHGKAGPWAERAVDVPLVIDLSADHRHDPRWVYGQAEWHRALLPGAVRIAVPGCFATAISLALAPFVASEQIEGDVQICAATGSTGSGATPKDATHHPLRFTNLKGYKILQHQHVPEVEAFLGGLGAVGRLHMVPLSAPIDRGILATCFLRPPEPLSTEAATQLLQDAYADHPLVRVRTTSPELRHVRGTAICDLAAFADGDQVVVLAAIDNLGKGAAGHAIQCLNLALGLPAELGLGAPPCLP
jgi:N-acetyl-gamma-glutamyl-phosphate reductase common form